MQAFDIVLLVIEIGMFALGLYLLIAGKIKLGKLALNGNQARLAGFFLLLPLALALLRAARL